METSTSSLGSPFFHLPSRPFSSSTKRNHAGFNQRRSAFAMRRSSEEDNYYHDQNFASGKMVDENMIVLRKRIHEMKMIERNYEPPSEWMDWEKRYFTNYDSMICDAMGFLQSHLMNTRPSLAIGMIALVALSVPTSSFVVMSQLMELSNGVLAGIHMS